MSSREKILQAITNNKPVFIEPPVMDIRRTVPEGTELIQLFVKTLEGIGGKVMLVENMNAVKEELERSKQDGSYIVNTISSLGNVNEEVVSTASAASLEPVYKAYIGGTLGVAENGSVWLYESQLKNRLLPFICQHLVLCLDAKKIVPTMHEAYAQIDLAKEGYGVFLAGPSKTADIEQSLVIGAHGARSLLVYLVG